MIRIKEYIPQDVQEDGDYLLPVLLELWNAPESLPFLSYSLKPVEESIIRFNFAHHLLLGERYFAAVDCDVGEHAIVGLSVLRIKESSPFELTSIAVDKAYAGRGVGGHLLDHAAMLARWEKCGAIETAVFEDNERMLALVRRLGYEEYERSENARADGMGLIRFRKVIVD